MQLRTLLVRIKNRLLPPALRKLKGPRERLLGLVSTCSRDLELVEPSQNRAVSCQVELWEEESEVGPWIGGAVCSTASAWQLRPD